MQFLTFIGFTALVAIISYYKTRNTGETSSDGYFLGGRSLTAGVIAGSLLLTNLSTEQIVGLNGASYAEWFICYGLGNFSRNSNGSHCYIFTA